MMIKTRRKELGLTQQELADMIGLSRGRIAQWEGGDAIPDDWVKDLARELKVTPDALRENTRVVRKDSELEEWLQLLFHDHETSDVIRPTLVWMGKFMLDAALREKGVYRYSGSIQQLAQNTPGVEEGELRRQWEDLLQSGYVRPVPHTECLDLVFPE